ncbi:MAG TPA: hypothetical protein VK250_12445 [Nitrososphaeraceae archaeon]|jgi:hypothetical protein|nr:hypothetical protein [Nitrososphaeraceae archaeon]
MIFKHLEVSENLNDGRNLLYIIEFNKFEINNSELEKLKLFASLSPDMISISVEDSNYFNNESTLPLRINLKNCNQTNQDIKNASRIRYVSVGNNLFEINLHTLIEKDYRLKYLKKILPLTLKVHKLNTQNTEQYRLEDVQGFALIILLDELISQSWDKDNLSIARKRILTKLSNAFLGDFLLKRIMFYKYREEGCSKIKEKAIEEYYELLLSNKLEEKYPSQWVSKELTYWFPHPETELLQIVNYFGSN